MLNARNTYVSLLLRAKWDRGEYNWFQVLVESWFYFCQRSFMIEGLKLQILYAKTKIISADDHSWSKVWNYKPHLQQWYFISADDLFTIEGLKLQIETMKQYFLSADDHSYDRRFENLNLGNANSARNIYYITGTNYIPNV